MNAEDNCNKFLVDEEDNFYDIASIRKYSMFNDINKASQFMGRQLSEEEFAKMHKGLCNEVLTSMHFCSSDSLMDFKFNRVPPCFLSNNNITGEYGVLMTCISYTRDPANSGKMSVDFLRDICLRFADMTNRISDTRFNSDDPFFIPRVVCFGINVRVVLEHIIAALCGIENTILEANDESKDSNADNAINVRLILRNLRALETLYTPNSGGNKFRELRTYEDIYQSFFDSINFTVNNLDKSKRNNYYKFVFLDNLTGYIDGFDDTDEKLLQYREVTKLVHLILTNVGMYKIEFGGAKHSIIEFVNLLNDILTLEKKTADEEYFVDSVAMSTLDEETQRTISNRVLSMIESSPEEFIYDESGTWLDNLIEYCSNNGMKIGTSIINGINLNFERYKVNAYQLISLDNKVVHTTVYSGDRAYKAVVNRYGLFGFDGTNVFKLRKVNDFRWLLR